MPGANGSSLWFVKRRLHLYRETWAGRRGVQVGRQNRRPELAHIA
jgi:hypothetical protein